MIQIALGVLILLGVFAGLFWLVASQFGWRVAALIWSVSIALTAVIVLAIWLITGSWS